MIGRMAAWVGLTMLCAAPAWAGAGRGSVAVVPTTNVSGERWAELKQRQCAAVDAWLRKHLPAAGYELVPSAQVQTTLGDARDSDEDAIATKDLVAIGDGAEADWVVFCSVTSTEQKEERRTWYKDKEGRTDVRVWLVDVRAKKAVLAGKTFVGRSGGNRVTLANKGSDRQVQAAANAVRDALREFLAPYRAK
jgi:hypothetical protein